MRQTFAAFAELVSAETEKAESKPLNEDAPLTQPEDIAHDAPPVDKDVPPGADAGDKAEKVAT
jgi:hypothetical protein